MKELEYLDKILLFIRNSNNSEASLSDICKEVTGSDYDPYIQSNKLDVTTVNDDIQLNGTLYEKQNKLIEALLYLQDCKLLRLLPDIAGYRLTFKGITKSYFGFVDEFKEKEEYKLVQTRNLIETTELAITQKIDIRKARCRSWWAICISILAIIVSVINPLQEHPQDKQQEKDNNSQPKKERLNVIPKDSVKLLHNFNC